MVPEEHPNPCPSESIEIQKPLSTTQQTSHFRKLSSITIRDDPTPADDLLV
tara:strand:+ start:203 stop:355 length:153 start_codon:yes stop_codon:yes gene_type:complete